MTSRPARFCFVDANHEFIVDSGVELEVIAVPGVERIAGFMAIIVKKLDIAQSNQITNTR
ncbi:MAG: hypothetical protein IIC10_04415 [Proteobacteria bacterium]|nr:hypothetical protein [Pseudomonadota bacterium]